MIGTILGCIALAAIILWNQRQDDIKRRAEQQRDVDIRNRLNQMEARERALGSMISRGML